MSAESAESARLFFALWPPRGLAEELVALARRIDNGRPSRADTVHLTLAFLGNVAVDRIATLHSVGCAVAAKAFELHLDRLGYWSDKRLLWAGAAEQPALTDLVGRLRSALASAGFAVDGANRPFIPHVTLLRKLPEKPAVLAFPRLDPWPCRGFVLVRSRLSAAGPAYEILAEFPLLP